MKTKSLLCAAFLLPLSCLITSSRADVVDSFDAGLGNWTAQSGDWSILPDNSLKGGWSYSSAYSQHGVLKLNSAYQPIADFTASIDFRRASNVGYYLPGVDPEYTAQANFGFIQSDGSRLDFGVSMGSISNQLTIPQSSINVGAQIYSGPGPYAQVGYSLASINWDPNVWNTFQLARTGDFYELFLNSVSIFSMHDTFYGGAGELALKTYGVSNLDNFVLQNSGSSVPDTSSTLLLIGFSFGALCAMRRLLPGDRSAP